MLSLSIRSRRRGPIAAPDEFGDIGKDGSDVFVSPVNVIASWEKLGPSISRGVGRGDLRYWPPILVLSEDMTDRTKKILRELFSGKLVHF